MDIIQYWHSDDPPGEIRDRIASVRAQNPNWRHVLFNEQSALDLIERHFTQRECAAFKACAVPAMKCDYFLFCALAAQGGVYIDADCLCLQPLQTLVDGSNGPFLFMRANGHVPNGFIAAPQPGHPLFRFSARIATLNVEQRALENVWAATGPGIITTIIALHRLGVSGFIDSFPERPAWTHEYLLHLANLIAWEAGDNLGEIVSGVTFAPADDLPLFLTDDPQPEYKSESDYWAMWQGSIYA